MKNKTTGGATIKKINGKSYYYYQWYEDGKKRSRIISEEDYFKLKDFSDSEKKIVLNRTNFKGIKMLVGEDLLKEIRTVLTWEKRDCFKDLMLYLNNPTLGKVLILYGLRRTGKTTMMFQSILEKAHEIDSIAYIKVNNGANIDDLYALLRQLVNKGFKYVYIDEVTLLNDFISQASVLSDLIALDTKIILSGTDSLGFAFAKEDQLYGRAFTIHTTYIPYKEFSRVLNIHDIDKYIEYGGTLVVEGINYHSFDSKPTFYDAKSTISYLDSSICKNIQNSLTNYKDGYNFERLTSLKSRDELTNVINRIIQDDTHRFVAEVVNRVFKSQDYGSLKQLLKSKTNYLNLYSFFDNIDEEKIYKDLMDRLDIKNDINVDDYTLQDLKEYFKMLDLIEEVDVMDVENGNIRKEAIFTQPGLRYSLAKQLIQTLMNDSYVQNTMYLISSFIYETILNDVKGKIMQDIILLNEIHNKNDNKVVLKGSFLTGEYDMMIFDKSNTWVDLFEIKHSSKKSADQIRHLLDKNKLILIEKHFGQIKDKFVIYRGPKTKQKDIKYLNVEEYLCK